MFKKIKNYFINKMYISCFDELITIRNFYRKNVLIDPCPFSDLPSEKRFKIYEEEILIHIPCDAYKIYKKKFGENFELELAHDAFGYIEFKYEVVCDLFRENCRHVK